MSSDVDWTSPSMPSAYAQCRLPRLHRLDALGAGDAHELKQRVRLSSGGDVTGKHLERPAFVDLEAYLDRDLSAGRGPQADEFNLPEVGIVGEHRVFALSHANADERLHVARRRERARS